VAIWPRPVQQPHPPVWVPVTGSKETIEWAARNNIPITPGLGGHRGVREDVTRYYARCLEQNGFRLTPDNLIIQANAYIADSKAKAVQEAGPYTLYFNRTLFSHGNITETDLQRDAGYLSSASFDYLRPENLPGVSGARERYRDMTLADLERQAENIPWGPGDEVRDRIIADADQAGASTVLVNMNRGAMPHEMFMEQIRRFAREVLPALQAHEVRGVPVS
jgi:alkanesulfonate monooxygenase SsuD/methylene tetrahydromethanopterin reductase-like flavin-dependent oxidoreductase (luciferase family)